MLQDTLLSIQEKQASLRAYVAFEHASLPDFIYKWHDELRGMIASTLLGFWYFLRDVAWLAPFPTLPFLLPSPSSFSLAVLSCSTPSKVRVRVEVFCLWPARPSKWGYPTLMSVGLEQRFWPCDPTRWPLLKKIKFEIKIIDFRFICLLLLAF